jgi:hypothetical protein
MVPGGCAKSERDPRSGTTVVVAALVDSLLLSCRQEFPGPVAMVISIGCKMKRISKSVGLSLFAVVLVPMTLSFPIAPFAQAVADSTESSEEAQLISEGALKITIIAGGAIAGVSAAAATRAQSSIATARTEVHGRVVHPERSEPRPFSQSTGRPSVGEVVLRGTSPGDVIRLEYIARTEAAMEQAVADLKEGKESWTNRAAELGRRHGALVEEVAEARRVFSGLPLNEQSKGLRYEALNKLTSLETELKIVKRTFVDAEMRMHVARGQYAAADKNLQVTRQFHKVNQQFRIVQDVYVDGRPGQIDAVLGRAMGETTLAAHANEVAPRVRITRIQIPNSSIVRRSLRNVKAGLWAAGISVALVLEEVTIGEISKSLVAKTQTHYSPETRFEPLDSGAPALQNPLLE